MMFDVYEHGDVRVKIPAKKGHWNQLTQSCSLRAAFLGANMQVIRIEPGEREICDFRSDPYPVRVYVTENFTFPKEARRPG